MRHGKKNNHLGRTMEHRRAMLSNMAASLILHKRISTTVAKAKALRKYVEPLLTKSKSDTTHSRRIVFRSLQNKYAVTELFREVAGKISDRPGGYTRIIRTGNRPGDAAEMCMMELVDYNTVYVTDKPAARKSRTTRRGRGKKTKAPETGAESASAPESAPEATAKNETGKEKSGEGDPADENKDS
jgi:large subunit ribosomal protein L17